MKNLTLVIALCVALSACATSDLQRNLVTGPVVKVGMTEAQLVEQMGKPKEVQAVDTHVNVFYWADLDTFSGRVRAVAFATRDGLVVNEPTLVKDRISENLMARRWD